MRKVKHKPMDGLRELREAKHMTQAKLGEISGVNCCSIGNYENGVSQPTLGIAIKLAKALGCTISELL